jgi:predicted Kef-type K+ transport protein
VREEAHPLWVAVVATIGFSAIVIALWAYWPAGVGLGLTLGIVATFLVGRRLQEQADLDPHDGELDLSTLAVDDFRSPRSV